MFNIQLLRDNPNLVKENIHKKFQDDKTSLVDEIVEKDLEWRNLKRSIDGLRADRNSLSLEVNDLKKQGNDASKALAKVKEIPKKIKVFEERSVKLKKRIDELLLKIPNMMNESVPSGRDDSDNIEVQTFGSKPDFDFDVKNHAELVEKLGLADFDSSANTSGSGFYYLEGDLALLNQALLQFAREKVVKHGFTYVETPLLLRESVIKNVTDLHDQENMIYKIDKEDLYLIGTSEHSLIGRYLDVVISEEKLPIKQTSYSMCFRKEIGSHGIDEKGLFRTHQFNKIELVVICHPEESMKYYEELKQITIDIFTELEIPIRELLICSGDLGNLKHIQVDIEAWSPRRQGYFEVGSCSNLTDAQARKLKIRVGKQEGKFVPHTLNNTAIATSRALVAILENFQQKDGSIRVPKVLQKYLGKEVIR